MVVHQVFDKVDLYLNMVYNASVHPAGANENAWFAPMLLIIIMIISNYIDKDNKDDLYIYILCIIIMNIDKIRKQSYKVGLEPLTKEWMDSLDG